LEGPLPDLEVSHSEDAHPQKLEGLEERTSNQNPKIETTPSRRLTSARARPENKRTVTMYPTIRRERQWLRSELIPEAFKVELVLESSFTQKGYSNCDANFWGVRWGIRKSFRTKVHFSYENQEPSVGFWLLQVD
jgi:hypothetical protein